MKGLKKNTVPSEFYSILKTSTVFDELRADIGTMNEGF